MSQILLLRHAQAMLPDSRGKDFDRCLSQNGEHDAFEQAQRIFNSGYRPDLVLCSAAQRTMQTAAIICDLFNSELPESIPLVPQAVEPLYRADACGYINAIRETAQQHTKCLLLVGHNPSIEDLALMFAANADEAITKRISHGFPTAGAAIIETTVPLPELRPESSPESSNATAKLTGLLFIQK